MSNETQASNFPGYFATNNGDQLAASISLAALTKDNYNPVDSITANGVNDLRRDVAKSEADIKSMIAAGDCSILKSIGDSECRVASKVADGDCAILSKIGDAECGINKEVNEVNRSLGLHIANSERDIQNRIHEARIETLRINTELSRYLADKTQMVDTNVFKEAAYVKEQMRQFQSSTDEKLCDVKSQVKDSERRILDQLCADKLDEKNDEIAALRAEKYGDRNGYNFNLQSQEINYLKNMLNSVEQTQKFNSKTSVFGAGNFVPTTQTANQG